MLFLINAIGTELPSQLCRFQRPPQSLRPPLINPPHQDLKISIVRFHRPAFRYRRSHWLWTIGCIIPSGIFTFKKDCIQKLVPRI
ncbi:hypothetical protein Hanom_Chr09g00763231 [Helianthus anomalus]